MPRGLHDLLEFLDHPDPSDESLYRCGPFTGEGNTFADWLDELDVAASEISACDREGSREEGLAALMAETSHFSRRHIHQN